MALQRGTRIATYEVLEPIGAGGMGEVYRASDTALGREVAIKILPASLRLDADASARFEREARLLAALNHPNIATLYDLEMAGDVQALVMELVEGESLDERIDRSPNGLPPAEALEIATQIASALDAAHEYGIVHRDLKPANIKIRPDGTIKVLDFGIAKALSKQGNASAIGTVTQLPAAIMGTPSYMSPEQASGADIDRRTDIWAFGCVLFEMLSGQRAFDGETSSRILARVLEREPDWRHLPDDLHARIREILAQCLEKNPRRRRRDAADLRLDLESVARERAEEIAERPQPRAWLLPLAGGVTIAAVAAAIAIALTDRPGPEPPRPFVADLVTGITSRQEQFALSPNGRYLATIEYLPGGSMVRGLFVRDLEADEPARLIPGTEWARNPCWSPDSRSLAFTADETLQRVDIVGGNAGGNPQRLAPAANAGNCAWSDDGQIVFGPNAVSGLYVVDEDGVGEHRPVTQTHVDSEPGEPDYEVAHRVYTFIPGTDVFIYRVFGGDDAEGIYLGSLSEEAGTRLIGLDSPATFVAPDTLIYSQGNQLIKHRLDLEARALTGDARVIVEASEPDGDFSFSASRNGERFAYRYAPEPPVWLTRIDRDGNKSTVLQRGFNGIALSPNDRWIAYDGTGPSGGRDVYRTSIDGTNEQRIVGEATVEGFPEFSPDSNRLVFERQRRDDQLFELWIADLATLQTHHLYDEASSQKNLIPIDWSSNGYILARRTDRDFLSTDLIAISASDPDAPPIEVASLTYAEERLGEFSPSGAHVVYDSTLPGRFGVYLQAFPDPSVDQVYAVDESAFAPRWNGDNEIVYLKLDGRIMSKTVTYLESGIELGPAMLISRERFGEPGFQHAYDITSDGQIFINLRQIEGLPPPIRLLGNAIEIDTRR